MRSNYVGLYEVVTLEILKLFTAYYPKVDKRIVRLVRK